MSDWNPLDGYGGHSDDMCRAIWKYQGILSEHINTLPEDQSKEYLKQYNATLGMLAELYFFSAISLSKIRDMERGAVQPLFEVSKGGSITLPSKPKEGKALRETAKAYRDKEPFLDWMKTWHKSKIGEE
jgi:hypothetical protein